MQRKDSSEETRRTEFMRLAFPHMNMLYGVALRLTGNRLDAEDMVQDTYLKAYRFFDRFERGTNFKAWLYRIMINLFRSRLRYVSRRPSLVFSTNLDRVVASPSYDHTDSTSGPNLDLFEDEVQRALERLAPNMRLVVELVDVQGLSYREAAEILDCPVGTVMSRLYRARGRLQRSLLKMARSRGYALHSELRTLC